jgi:hypothetical protein
MGDSTTKDKTKLYVPSTRRTDMRKEIQINSNALKSQYNREAEKIDSIPVNTPVTVTWEESDPEKYPVTKEAFQSIQRYQSWKDMMGTVFTKDWNGLTTTEKARLTDFFRTIGSFANTGRGFTSVG